MGLESAVVKQDALTGPQPGAYFGLRELDVAGGAGLDREEDGLAVLDLEGFVKRQRSFGPGRSARTAVCRPAFLDKLAEPADPAKVILGVAVREIDPGDIKTEIEESFENAGTICRGAERGDDPCATSHVPNPIAARGGGILSRGGTRKDEG